MDFKGQKLSERISQLIVGIAAAFGFLVGYVLEDFGVMMKIFSIGVLVAFVVTVLDWPMYNKNPVTWRRPKNSASGSGGGGRKNKQNSWRSLFT